MFQLPCKFGKTTPNSNWVIALTSSPGTNYDLNGHEDLFLVGNNIQGNTMLHQPRKSVKTDSTQLPIGL